MSNVALKRSDDPREQELASRLVESIRTQAGAEWETIISWGEEDGTEGALEKLAAADALIIMGGPDVSPSLYGGPEDYPGKERHYPRSDAAQIALIQTAIERHIPMLGICRGMQLLNIAQSGTLVQDISELPGHSSPDLLDGFEFCRHTVNIDASSQLAEAFSACPTDANNPSFLDGSLRTLVHSAHHQAVDVLGEDMVITARADDGTIEAVEHISAPAIGVQWHPEDPDADPRGLHCLLRRMHSHCCAVLAA